MVKNFKGHNSIDQSTWAQVQDPCIREATVWASRTLYVGGGMGSGQGFLHMRLQALLSAEQTTVGTACLGGGALGLPSSVERQWWEGEVVLL